MVVVAQTPIVGKLKRIHMTKVINSSVIGPLKQDERFADWWKSDPIPVPFFDNLNLTILFTGFKPENDPTFIDQANQALKTFLGLAKADRKNLSELAYKNCKEFLAQIFYRQMDQALRDIKDENDIWQFIEPTKI